MNPAVRLGPKLSETVKGKLSLGARILQVGGVEKVFKQKFNVADDEKLLKASQCYYHNSWADSWSPLFQITELPSAVRDPSNSLLRLESCSKHIIRQVKLHNLLASAPCSYNLFCILSRDGN
ncbi:UNVERIFIED_CONTAM: putative GEM-like protein 8 [Sesamum radiatum]|uniref:GEM-like protein 8 n=1 Tax=Sesamum radiatum TaxID=300843 RepID=A0AAW2U029_SESRA